MFLGTGKPPWQRITKDDLSLTIAHINQADPKRVLLSAHDTCDHALDRLADELRAETTVLVLGEALLIGAVSGALSSTVTFTYINFVADVENQPGIARTEQGVPLCSKETRTAWTSATRSVLWRSHPGADAPRSPYQSISTIEKSSPS